jgi:hypothetical protein
MLVGLLRGLGHEVDVASREPDAWLECDLVVLRPWPCADQEALARRVLALEPARLLLVTPNGALAETVRQAARCWVDVVPEPCLPEDLAMRVRSTLGHADD